MPHFSKKELLNIAKLSAIELKQQEIDLFKKQLNEILTYIAQLNRIETGAEAEPIKNINMLREDIPQKSNYAQDIINQAPEREGNYFVVPKIID